MLDTHSKRFSYITVSKPKVSKRDKPQGKTWNWSWKVCHSNTGAKSAYVELKRDLKGSLNYNTKDLMSSKAYQIVSTDYQDLPTSLNLMRSVNLFNVRKSAIGCIVLSETSYLFFWRDRPLVPSENIK
jgi:hypothetical protein